MAAAVRSTARSGGRAGRRWCRGHSKPLAGRSRRIAWSDASSSCLDDDADRDPDVGRALSGAIGAHASLGGRIH
jgi:hypothetical protein